MVGAAPVVVVIAVVNGVLHRAYERPLGQLPAHQLSAVILLLMLAPWVAAPSVDTRP